MTWIDLNFLKSFLTVSSLFSQSRSEHGLGTDLDQSSVHLGIHLAKTKDMELNELRIDILEDKFQIWNDFRLIDSICIGESCTWLSSLRWVNQWYSMAIVPDGTSNTMSDNRRLHTHSTGCELQSVQGLPNLHKAPMRSSIFLQKILDLKGSRCKIGSSVAKKLHLIFPFIYFTELHSLEMLFKTILETRAKHCRSKAQLIRPAACSKAGFTQTSSAVRQFPPMEPSKILARPTVKAMWNLAELGKMLGC